MKSSVSLGKNAWLKRLALLVCLLPGLIGTIEPAQAQTAVGLLSLQSAQNALSVLTPEEKVGQLMLVTFKGYATESNSQIYDLITNHHVGGVVLKAANDNFTGPEGTALAAYDLTSRLQRFEWLATEQAVGEVGGSKPAYVPLLITISQEGDGYPYSEIYSGVTQLPNQMALGATWDTDLARQTGQVLGQELAALGINLLLGPSLDVLDDPSPEGPGDLGTRTFGGDPFWVAEFGKAYITGVHQGSQNKVAVVAKYFPGRGSSDRSPEGEVATIRKTLEQLKQIELAPFFEVTGDSPTTEATADGLLTSHIKYQGFQTNIRATTRPISFDPQAFNQLINLPAFSSWRKNGGIMVSDDLGSNAVRRFFDPTGENVNARFVARDALLAGNDLLYFGNLVSSEDPNSYTSVIRTLEFFTQKYQEDTVFAQRVDEAVLRILSLKYKLYPDFTLDGVVPDPANLGRLDTNTQLIFDIARQGATLISPDAEELETSLPNPPAFFERVIFFSDTQEYQQCSECPPAQALSLNAFRDVVIRLYGPQTGGQVQERNLLSYTFENLTRMLDLGPSRTEVEFNMKSTQWLVFAMLDARTARANSIALKRLLDERPDLLRDKKIVVFAFNAPYYLDATDISKLNAYYSLYSKGPAFIEVAARLLFGEISPTQGALPVNVEGIGYELIEVTAPDPRQTIPLSLDLPGLPPGETPTTPEATQLPDYQVGDLAPVVTGVIVDHNGNPVPDNTPVVFRLSLIGERNTVLKEIATVTAGGISRATFPIEMQGNLEISVRSEPATLSTVISLSIAGERPTPTATITPSPSPTLEPTQTTTPTPGADSIAVPDQVNPPFTALLTWLMAAGSAVILGWVAFQSTLMLGQARWSMRMGLLVLICGLTAYIYVTLNLPGSTWIGELDPLVGSLLSTMVGGVVGLFLGLIWRRAQNGAATASQH